MQFEDGVEDAHLIPSAERQWFNNNNMAIYINSTRADKIKDRDNSIRLRSDIRTLFDAKRFAIVPIGGRLVVYCMNTVLGSQVERLYHGVEVHRICDSGCLGEFLFARFAYTVFEQLQRFLEANTSRKLRLRVDNETAVEICSPERCWRFAKYTASRGKSGSISPKKRPHSEVEPAVDSDGDATDAEFRGRKRRRSGETESFASSVLSSSMGYSAESSAGTPGTPPLPGHKVESTTDRDLALRAEGCKPDG